METCGFQTFTKGDRIEGMQIKNSAVRYCPLHNKLTKKKENQTSRAQNAVVWKDNCKESCLTSLEFH